MSLNHHTHTRVSLWEHIQAHNYWRKFCWHTFLFVDLNNLPPLTVLSSSKFSTSIKTRWLAIFWITIWQNLSPFSISITLSEKIKKENYNLPLIVNINDTPTNFSTPGCQTALCINFSKISPRDFKSNIRFNKFNRGLWNCNTLNQIEIKTSQSSVPFVSAVAELLNLMKSISCLTNKSHIIF